MNLRELGAKALPTNLTCEREFAHGFFVTVQYCPEGRYLNAVQSALRKASKGGRRKKVDEREVARGVLAKYVTGWRGLNYAVLIKEGVCDPAKLRKLLDAEAEKAGSKKLSEKAWDAKKLEELPFGPEDCLWLLGESLDLETFVVMTMTDPDYYGLTGAEDESKN